MAQSLARLWTHLIFSTKNRFPFPNDKKLKTDMHAYLAQVLRQQDCETWKVAAFEYSNPFVRNIRFTREAGK